tara:strand:+ start:127126 stop:127575 length:450 start_codon:yes stop_codon:yes gene_type:complete
MKLQYICRQMTKAFLKYFSFIGILLGIVSVQLFANTNYVVNRTLPSVDLIELSDATSISNIQDYLPSVIKLPSSENDKRLEVIEIPVEEEIERLSSKNDNINKTYFFDVFVSLKSDDVSHQNSTQIANRICFSYFTYKSLYIKFCSFRI